MKLLRYLPLLLLLQAPVKAQSQGGNAIAAPVATSSGSVTNQAVQVVPSTNFSQNYGRGVMCQGTTLTASTFGLGRITPPESHVGTDYGITLQVTTPLDGRAVELCKKAAELSNRRAQIETDKAELDYHLVRQIKCGENIKQGVFYHPSSPYASVCLDVVAMAPDGSYRNGVGQVMGAQAQQTQDKLYLSSP